MRQSNMGNLVHVCWKFSTAVHRVTTGLHGSVASNDIVLHKMHRSGKPSIGLKSFSGNSSMYTI